MVMDAIVWDMDGTLTDSEPLWGIATYEMAENLGRPLTPELRQETVGGSFANTYRVCCRNAGVPVTEQGQKDAFAWMVDRMAGLFAERLVVEEHVTSLLGACADAGIPMAVATNTPRIIAQPALDVIGTHFFQATVCGDEVTRGKPAPDIYMKAVSLLGAHAENSLAFEDSTTGMLAARDAGLVVVGLPHSETAVPTGVTPIGELLGHEPNAADSLARLDPASIVEIFDSLRHPGAAV